MKTLTEIDNDMMYATVENAYLDAAGVQKLLEFLGSWLKDYKINGRQFSEWLFEAATAAGIEPIFALAMLQKEQGITQAKTKPVKRVLDRACGFGCPDNAPDKTEYYGFEKQILSMLSQFEKYDEWDCIINYKDTPVKLVDTGETVLAGNEPTAKNLLYNPWLEGITILKKVWNRYYNISKELKFINEE